MQVSVALSLGRPGGYIVRHSVQHVRIYSIEW